MEEREKEEVVNLMKIARAAVETAAYDVAYEIIRMIHEKLDLALDGNVHHGYLLKKRR